MTTLKVCMSLNLVKIPSITTELSALERLKKEMNSIVTSLAPLFLIGFLQITRTTIKSQMGLKFCQIRLLAAALAALERQEKSP